MIAPRTSLRRSLDCSSKVEEIDFMRRTGVCLALATLILGGLVWVGPAVAQSGSMHGEHMEHMSSPAAGGAPTVAGLRASVVHQIGEAQKKLTALAEAMPAEKYSWRPGAGVRSVGELLMHVAGGNYLFASTWGAKVPEGVNPRGFEKDAGDKAKTLAALRQSFDFLNQAVAALPDADLGRSVDFFGHPVTTWDLIVIAATHAHEHLGQSIAYARSNGVVPPWSAAPGKGND
jgi:uncharacterized damage-inducible protein DinB